MQYTDDEINESLKETEGNRDRAARILGANPCTIHRRLKKMKALKRSEHILNPD
jgi:DNA-binding NtrC family response regulator